MPFDFSQIRDQKFIDELKKSPHLLNHIENYTARGNPLPLFTEQLQAEHKKLKEPNLLYPIAEQVYIHINPHTSSDDGYMEYVIVEPDAPDRKIMECADKMFAVQSADLIPPVEITERFNMVETYLKEHVDLTDAAVNYDTIGDIYKLKDSPCTEKRLGWTKASFFAKKSRSRHTRSVSC
ncbi:hypothetical protein QVH35_04175 [Candidatus Nitrosotenuis chungbukensis]|uniref:hypothetical protein n=1 Tax=Candidatus Nitrosotenuis chungbukensis TaxID=1353246 RepID=UPI0026741B21|nr:hypothetical protein [Candidatus Nitrosotenuis chungbukensis]WKT58582.1 hypothetical protein QVH35_04175 [Candidatus Nitrosotenuis chungbukensis]